MGVSSKNKPLLDCMSTTVVNRNRFSINGNTACVQRNGSAFFTSFVSYANMHNYATASAFVTSPFTQEPIILPHVVFKHHRRQAI